MFFSNGLHITRQFRMLRISFLVLLSLGLLGALTLMQVHGQEKKGNKYNQKIKIGQTAPMFSDLPGVDGKKHSLADLSNKDVVVVVITCNHCPVAIAYENRLIEFAKKYTVATDSKVALVAINVNNSDEDKLTMMIERSKQKSFNFPYLHDASQQIARDLGAAVTPEFFVLNKERKIVYTGAMDDSMRVGKVKSHYLEDAVMATLKGEMPAMTMTPREGCGVQYDK